MSNLTDRLKAKLLAKKENIEYLRYLCEQVFPFTPDDYQLDIWLIYFPVDIVSDAIQVAAAWYVKHHQTLEQAVAAGTMTQDEAFAKFKSRVEVINYAYGCMRNMKAQREVK
jgi:hypothetical protein